LSGLDHSGEIHTIRRGEVIQTLCNAPRVWRHATDAELLRQAGHEHLAVTLRGEQLIKEILNLGRKHAMGCHERK
jgi:hypothetical protein